MSEPLFWQGKRLSDSHIRNLHDEGIEAGCRTNKEIAKHLGSEWHNGPFMAALRTITNAKLRNGRLVRTGHGSFQSAPERQTVRRRARNDYWLATQIQRQGGLMDIDSARALLPECDIDDLLANSHRLARTPDAQVVLTSIHLQTLPLTGRVASWLISQACNGRPEVHAQQERELFDRVGSIFDVALGDRCEDEFIADESLAEPLSEWLRAYVAQHGDIQGRHILRDFCDGATAAHTSAPLGFYTAAARAIGINPIDWTRGMLSPATKLPEGYVILF